jgi:hypothetical protein
VRIAQIGGLHVFPPGSLEAVRQGADPLSGERVTLGKAPTNAVSLEHDPTVRRARRRVSRKPVCCGSIRSNSRRGAALEKACQAAGFSPTAAFAANDYQSPGHGRRGPRHLYSTPTGVVEPARRRPSHPARRRSVPPNPARPLTRSTPYPRRTDLERHIRRSSTKFHQVRRRTIDTPRCKLSCYSQRTGG